MRPAPLLPAPASHAGAVHRAQGGLSPQALLVVEQCPALPGPAPALLEVQAGAQVVTRAAQRPLALDAPVPARRAIPEARPPGPQPPWTRWSRTETEPEPPGPAGSLGGDAAVGAEAHVVRGGRRVAETQARAVPGACHPSLAQGDSANAHCGVRGGSRGEKGRGGGAEPDPGSPSQGCLGVE